MMKDRIVWNSTKSRRRKELKDIRPSIIYFHNQLHSQEDSLKVRILYYLTCIILPTFTDL